MMYYVYILSNSTNSTVYIGMTNDLVRRVYEHKSHLDPSAFSSQYNTEKLVYYEETPEVEAAISREKQLKKFKRAKKDRLISRFNPNWKDLYHFICGDE